MQRRSPQAGLGPPPLRVAQTLPVHHGPLAYLPVPLGHAGDVDVGSPYAARDAMSQDDAPPTFPREPATRIGGSNTYVSYMQISNPTAEMVLRINVLAG